MGLLLSVFWWDFSPKWVICHAAAPTPFSPPSSQPSTFAASYCRVWFNRWFPGTLELRSVILQLSELGRGLKQYSLRNKRIGVYWLGSASLSRGTLEQQKTFKAKNKKNVKTKQKLGLNCFVSHFTGTSGAGVVEGTGEWNVQPWSSGNHHWGAPVLRRLRERLWMKGGYKCGRSNYSFNWIGFSLPARQKSCLLLPCSMEGAALFLLWKWLGNSWV